MEFGIQFFPAVGPDQKPADQYWREALELTQLAEGLGFTNVRTVEHYFLSYGGYSPDPLIFLSAAAALTRSMRLITGAVLPVFNNPLKLAGQIGMVDAISAGRLEVGFARAFLPHEFARFGVSMDESRARFEEGLEQVRRLLEEENVTAQGRFHSFENATSLPRPTQKPRPPFWIAALSTRETFETAGALGHYLMGIPLGGAHMAGLLKSYRDAWTAAGHPGRGKVMLAFHMYCAETTAQAAAVARAPPTSISNRSWTRPRAFSPACPRAIIPTTRKRSKASRARRSSPRSRKAWRGSGPRRRSAPRSMRITGTSAGSSARRCKSISA